MRRIYILNGTEINSKECDGFLHRARTDRGYCPACGNQVLAGQEYILLNYFGCPDPFHLQCFIDDHPQHAIIGIKEEKRKTWWGIEKKYVICKDYSIPKVDKNET